MANKLYLILNKNTYQYIDILMKYLPNNVIIRNKLIGIKENELVIIISINILGLALKLGFNNIYYFNIEQMTIRIAYLENKELSQHANRVNIMLNDLFKQDFSKFKIIDYSKENSHLWETYFNKKVSYILEPYYPLQNNINITNKVIDYISLINHDYRPKYIKQYLPNLYPRITNFLGYFDKDRRHLLSKSKIMINIHTSETHNIGELFRVNEALAHKVIVISQSCYKNSLITLKDFIIWIDNDKEIEYKCKYVLEHYDKYYKYYFIDNANKLEEHINKIKTCNNYILSSL